MSETVDSQSQQEKKKGFFSRLKSGLVKTRDSLAGGVENVIQGKAQVGPELLEELEEVLLLGDMGFETSEYILKELKSEVAKNRIRTQEEVQEHLKTLMTRVLEENDKPLPAPAEGPLVVLVIGVNGSGKTTTIGKLAKKWKEEGKRVLVGAGDTFRAAAIEQLSFWAERIDVPCIKHKSGSDPSAVAYDAVQAAVARNMDAVIVDTAGRLQTNQNLMEELKKVKRVIGKVLPDAPHETLLVLDASIGQNSISQARLFHEGLSIDGLVMTKLDGTSKGGVLLNITRELKLPVRYIGIGEKDDDLQEFNARDFVQALFEK